MEYHFLFIVVLPFSSAYEFHTRFEQKHGFYFYPLPHDSPNGYSLESTISEVNWVVRIQQPKIGEDFISFLSVDSDRLVNSSS